MQFDGPISITEWLPQGRRGFGQQFVDELFHQKRLRGANEMVCETLAESAGLAEQLLDLKLALERAAEELALDAAVAARHLATLQSVDAVGHSLARLAAQVAVQNASSEAPCG